MLTRNEPTAKEKFLSGFSAVLQKYRLILLGIIGLILIIVISAAIFDEVRKGKIETSTILAENVQNDYVRWLNAPDEDKEIIENNILTDIEFIIDQYPLLFASQRALFVKANILFEKTDYLESAAAFLKISEDYPQSYLASICLFNAAIAYEEAEDPAEALKSYTSLVQQYRDTAAETVHALFSIGRLNETLENEEEAVTAYNDLINNFSTSNWTKLARDRIILIETR